MVKHNKISMFDTESLDEKAKEPGFNMQNLHTDPMKLPEGAILLSILKTIEVQLQQKGFLEASGHSFNPLWFIAETERNVFLWRQGLSISDQHNFEFWVDVPKLIQKRIDMLFALERGEEVVNPLWNTLPVSSQEEAKKERDYLTSFIEATDKIKAHISALSEASLILESELKASQTKREYIILPL